jgi:UDP-N-acetylglucosamine--N-acetylmuramyl-(pentapeptide) pyrophosphoryl-undecaprenol N-acetylglucosamine transferase
MGVKTLMIAGGGTGGHIYPAIAIAREYLSRDPERNVVFVGTARGLEKTIVPKAGLPLGFIQAWKHVGRHRPNVVLGVGGYSSGPVLVAASLRGVPTIIHDANAFPGLANRVLARWVTTVAAAFAEALPRMKRTDGVVTGNPIRKEFFDLGKKPHEPATSNQQRLLLFGGSQGSRILNDTMTAALPHLAPLQGKLEIVHQTGPNEHEKVLKAYQQSPFANARVVPYLDPMADEIAAADLVVSRAGAMTIGELAAIGRAAILIPFAQATNNHQELNARVVEKAGGAVVITEAELSPKQLAGAISEVLSDPQRAQRMGTASKTLATPDATKSIVDLIEKIQRD